MMDEGRVHIWLSVGSSHPHPRQANSDSLLPHFLLLKGLKQQHFRRRVKGVQKPPARPQRDVWGDREGAPPSRLLGQPSLLSSRPASNYP